MVFEKQYVIYTSMVVCSVAYCTLCPELQSRYRVQVHKETIKLVATRDMKTKEGEHSSCHRQNGEPED